MKNPLKLPAFLALVCVCGAAHAQVQTQRQTPAPETSPLIDFATVDKNTNGSLSKEEALVISDLENSFDALDVDRDQMLSPAEFARWTRAGKTVSKPRDPATAPGGSAGAQHVPDAGEE